MTLKSCIGDRALGWDLLPPGSKGYIYDNKSYAGYHEVTNSARSLSIPLAPRRLNGAAARSRPQSARSARAARPAASR